LDGGVANSKRPKNLIDGSLHLLNCFRSYRTQRNVEIFAVKRSESGQVFIVAVVFDRHFDGLFRNSEAEHKGIGASQTLTIRKYLRIIINEVTMPKRYTSAELIKMVENDGWVLARVNGSHHHFHHLDKKGIVTIPHPVKDMDPRTANSIRRQAGLKKA